jgi:chromate transporter
MNDSGSPRGLAEIAWVFLRLGCFSFGGPLAHLGFLRAEFVERRRWLDEVHYADMVALCQFLPGPTSSQVVFALGMQRAGLVGAFTASVCFTLPSALLMIGFAFAVAAGGDIGGAGWIHGLKLAAVAVVAQAVWGMAKKLCPDRARASLCLVAASVLLVIPGGVAQLGVIACGSLAGFWLYRGESTTEAQPSPAFSRRHQLFAAAALASFVGLLALLPVLASVTGSRPIAEFDSFYRAGSLVFGGGHVVLPLLRAEIIPRGWLSDDQFLAGYGAAQAVPGPLFTFAAFLGAGMSSGAGRLGNGLWAMFAILLPSWLLIGGAWPFWQRLRTTRFAQSALAGANAAVVGVLLAALYNPVFTESVHRRSDMLAVLVAFGLLEFWRVAPWLVVAGMAAVGHWALPL